MAVAKLSQSSNTSKLSNLSYDRRKFYKMLKERDVSNPMLSEIEQENASVNQLYEVLKKRAPQLSEDQLRFSAIQGTTQPDLTFEEYLRRKEDRAARKERKEFLKQTGGGAYVPRIKRPGESRTNAGVYATVAMPTY
jgi:hypothetical protein